MVVCRLVLLMVLLGLSATAQVSDGEIRLTIRDERGQAIPAAVEIRSAVNAIEKALKANANGSAVFSRLPYGAYQYVISQGGFATETGSVDIHSALPAAITVTLHLGAVATTVDVNASNTLLDPHDVSTPGTVGQRQIAERPRSSPGRSIPDLIATQPGWLLEANGVVHPRGSEYQVQYVVDGLPLTDNRSPSFAPPFDTDDVQSMRILTGSYPAEFGRKLGGVIAVTTTPDTKTGWHGVGTLGGGSFGSQCAYLSTQYDSGKNLFGISGTGERTDRYLDPPVLQNYTNSATTNAFAGQYQRDFTGADRLIVSYRRGEAKFTVPNELTQQAQGQRQDRQSNDSEVQARYQRIISPSMLFTTQGYFQDVSANLRSNTLSTPIEAFQDRGFRQAYGTASVSGQNGGHDWKAGVDFIYASLRERFSYAITNPDMFDHDTPQSFVFRDRGRDREAAGYMQDVYRWRNVSLSAGLRWDTYHLLTDDNAISPRFGGSFYWPRTKLLFHGSYDRVFQTPAIENLLLASSASVASLSDEVLRIPVPASRGNFYEAGVSRVLGDHLRLDVTWFHRGMSNYADDDVLFNTGVSFPISFARAEVEGTEVRLQLPRWGPVSAFLSYSNQVGTGYLPVTGGLFLGDDATGEIGRRTSFPITQDQRNTAAARVRYDLTRRIWLASSAAYGSGLPTELQGADVDELERDYSPEILTRVNIARNRVRPSFNLSFSGGATLWQRETKSANVQVDVLNVTDRLNVINFAGLFSGTAIAPPRSASARLNFTF